MAVVTAATALGVSIAGALGGGALITGVAGTLGTFGFAAIGFTAQAALGLALNALTPKPKIPTSKPRGYTVNQRQPALDHQIIYGRARVGGAIVFQGTTGKNNKFLHQVVAYTGHEIEEFEDIYINDAKVTNLESDGNVKEIELPDGTTSNRYDGKLRIKQHLGESNQAADSDLVSEFPKWTNNHRLRGLSYLYCRFEFDSDVYPNGVPQVTTTIKGKKVFDPRNSQTYWSDNPALCLRDYIKSGYGLDESTDNIDDSLVRIAADVCDRTALNGKKWYTCNGNFTTELTPYDALNDLLSSMGGLLWYSQGKWRMKPAYWTPPEITLTEDDLRSEVRVQTRHSRRDNFNTVKGTFRGEETDWQVADFPEVTNQAFLNQDNGQESVIDFELPFTDNSEEARRISRIALERNRQQLTVQASWGLRAFQVQVGSVVNLSIDRFGWDQKAFEVTSWTFGLTDAQDLQVQMTLREISENVFDEVDDGVVYERDNTTLLSPFEVPSVGLSISNELSVFKEKLVNKVTITPTSGNTEAIDQVEVEYKPSSESDWITVGFGELGKFILQDIEDGDYDFRARAINTFGVKGDYTFRFNVAIAGISEPPSNITGFTSEVNGAVINLGWDAVPDLDLSYYRIRYSPNTSASVSWANSVNYSEKIPRPATSITVPARAGTFLIKAIDKSGTESSSATTLVVDSSDLESFGTTLTQTEDPTFDGVKTDCFVDSSTNSLQIGEQELFDSLTGDVDDLVGLWDDLGSAISGTAASYEFSNYIDIGAVRRARVRVDSITSRFNSSGSLWDNLNEKIDNLPGLWDELTENSDFADTNVKAFVSTTNDDPSGTPNWSDYKPLRVSDISARAFRFKINLEADNSGITPRVEELSAKVQYN